MKELTIEEKAARYDEAIDIARKINSGEGVAAPSGWTTCEVIFPELRESEDEKIRKDIIVLVKDWWDRVNKDNISTKEQMIAWLEKQGEHANFRNKIQIGDKVTRNEDGVLVNMSQLKRVAKPADKIEPKFKVGDWVILNNIVAQILDKQKYGFVGLDINGKDFFCNYGHTSSMCLWTINDAKDGDVLATDDGLCIFNGTLEKGKYPIAYCGITKRGFDFYDVDLPFSNDDNIHPATKEQRDLLFQKMKEAGYEWDSEKKELRKIEQKQKWSEEDEKTLKSVITNYESGYLPSIDKRDEIIKKLKTFKLKKQWKPSKEQMEILNMVLTNESMDDNVANILRKLREQLKKLMEE